MYSAAIRAMRREKSFFPKGVNQPDRKHARNYREAAHGRLAGAEPSHPEIQHGVVKRRIGSLGRQRTMQIRREIPGRNFIHPKALLGQSHHPEQQAHSENQQEPAESRARRDVPRQIRSFLLVFSEEGLARLLAAALVP